MIKFFKWIWNLLFGKKDKRPDPKPAPNIESKAELTASEKRQQHLKFLRALRAPKGRQNKGRNRPKKNHGPNTKLQPINRHGELGFAIRMANKSSRRPGRKFVPTAANPQADFTKW